MDIENASAIGDENQQGNSSAKSLFISYSHDDRTIVYLIVSLLKAAEKN